jgi:metallo-beta-lactamase family protein
MKAQITFWSGVGTVTGANFLLELTRQKLLGQELTGRELAQQNKQVTKKILVDCGLLQGEKMAPADNRKAFPYLPAEIDCLFVTHAHLDHVGKIPKLVRDGFKGVIYSTSETKQLAQLILEDSVHLIQREATEDGALPLYEQKDIFAAMALWKEIPYHVPTSIFPEDFPEELTGQSVSVYLRDAGHILGSAMIEFSFMGEGGMGGSVEGKSTGSKSDSSANDKNSAQKGKQTKIVFTGDLGNSPTPLLENTEWLTDTNYLVMESVYGDRNHEPVDERKKKLARIISDAVAHGGTLVVPAFSIERTQVILYELNNLVEEQAIPDVPVFVDSPLAEKVTDVYRRSSRFFNQGVRDHIAHGDQIFDFPHLKYTMTSRDSREIEQVTGPKIIIAGSGMSTGGRVTHHEAAYLPDPKSTILLVGYQALGTLGRQLQDGEKSVKIWMHGHDVAPQEVAVRAHIETIFGYSSHKDSDHLVEFVESTTPSLRKVFVVMGEPKASLFLVQKLRDNLGVDTIVPDKGKVYELK